MPDREMIERLKQARFEEERSHLIQIRNDIQWFCYSIQQLFVSIRKWLRGSAVSIVESVINFTDKSIYLWPDSSPLQYKTNTLSIRKNKKIVEIAPVAIYSQIGSRGIVSLRIYWVEQNNPLVEYHLSLQRATSDWTIRATESPLRDATLLNKSSFRSAITALLKG